MTQLPTVGRHDFIHSLAALPNGVVQHSPSWFLSSNSWEKCDGPTYPTDLFPQGLGVNPWISQVGPCGSNMVVSTTQGLQAFPRRGRQAIKSLSTMDAHSILKLLQYSLQRVKVLQVLLSAFLSLSLAWAPGTFAGKLSPARFWNQSAQLWQYIECPVSAKRWDLEISLAALSSENLCVHHVGFLPPLGRFFFWWSCLLVGGILHFCPW